MAAAKIVFHPGASEDYAEAFGWYYSHGSGIAFDFEREIERGIRLIAQNPRRWPRFDHQRRRLIVRKFPYSLIYEVYSEESIILPVAHGKRKPSIRLPQRLQYEAEVGL